MHITTPTIFYKNLIVRIQRRLVVTICALPSRSKHNIVIPKAPIPHDSISTLIEKSEHTRFEDDCGKRVCCIRCNISLCLSSPSLKHWLKGHCHNIGSAIDRPIALLSHAVHIKNQSIHSSHKLFKYRDICITAKCVGHTVGLAQNAETSKGMWTANCCW